MQASGLETRWASAPGETIAAAMRERAMTAAGLAQALHLPLAETSEILAGQHPITISTARRLAETIGGSAEFWIAREAQYLDDLNRVRDDKWSQSLPVAQMASFGWIDTPSSWHEQIKTCLDFFAVEDVEEWERNYGRHIEMTRFRTSPTFSLDAAATTAWFRACERAADRLPRMSPYDPDAFLKVLPQVRDLTREKDPTMFLPRLTELCALAGVLIVLVRPPTGCPVSGATRRYGDGPLIQLSARHLSDDHFWFTFFHEAGHALLHDLDHTYVDVFDKEERDEDEQQADAFAGDWLMSRTTAPSGRVTSREAVRLALANGVSPGIVVGQLQHSGRLRQSQLNHLKRRFVWSGSSLEKKRKN